MSTLRALEHKMSLGGLRPLSTLIAATAACLLYGWFEYPFRALVFSGELRAPTISLAWLPDTVSHRVSTILPCLQILPIAVLAGRHLSFLVYAFAALVFVGGGEFFAALSPYHIFNMTFDFSHPPFLSFFLSLLAPWIFFGLFLQLFATKQTAEQALDDDLNGFQPYFALLCIGGIAIILLASRYLFFLAAGYSAPLSVVGAATVTMLMFGPNPLVGVFGGLSAIMLTHKLPPRLALPAYVFLALFPAIAQIGITPSRWSAVTKFGFAPIAYAFGMYLAGAVVYGALLVLLREKSSLDSLHAVGSDSAKVAQTAS